LGLSPRAMGQNCSNQHDHITPKGQHDNDPRGGPRGSGHTYWEQYQGDFATVKAEETLYDPELEPPVFDGERGSYDPHELSDPEECSDDEGCAKRDLLTPPTSPSLNALGRTSNAKVRPPSVASLRRCVVCVKPTVRACGSSPTLCGLAGEELGTLTTTS
jgi:hypothetical protein